MVKNLLNVNTSNVNSNLKKVPVIVLQRESYRENMHLFMSRTLSVHLLAYSSCNKTNFSIATIVMYFPNLKKNYQKSMCDFLLKLCSG